MIGWAWDSTSKRLSRLETSQITVVNQNPKLRRKRWVKCNLHRGCLTTSLSPQDTGPSCFDILALENTTLELKPRYAYMLRKFTGIENAYLFLQEFKEACSMMCYPNVRVNHVQFKFVPFALKDQAKKWMYSLPANSITNKDGFVQVFLLKYFLNGKTVKLQHEIN